MGYFDNFKHSLFFLPSRKLATDNSFSGDSTFKKTTLLKLQKC